MGSNGTGVPHDQYSVRQVSDMLDLSPRQIRALVAGVDHEARQAVGGHCADEVVAHVAVPQAATQLPHSMQRSNS